MDRLAVWHRRNGEYAIWQRLVEPRLRRLPGGLIRPGRRTRHESYGPLNALPPRRLAPGDDFGPQPAQVLLVLAEFRRFG